MRSYCATTLTAHKDQVDEFTKQLKELGYCYELRQYKTEPNPYREYEFRVFTSINLLTGQVVPQ